MTDDILEILRPRGDYLNSPERQADARRKQRETMLANKVEGKVTLRIVRRKKCERCDIKYGDSPEFPDMPCAALQKMTGMKNVCSLCHAELPCPCRDGQTINLMGPPKIGGSSIESLDVSAKQSTRGARPRIERFTTSGVHFTGGEKWR